MGLYELSNALDKFPTESGLIINKSEIRNTLSEELNDCDRGHLMDIILDTLTTEQKIELLNQFAIEVN